ncbi:TPA: PEGA domain-containing protein [Candidatus Woesearchaeota archaeon]|nr:PEGA domain-containing protein [Candidatus Woesearchaeota archaeon]
MKSRKYLKFTCFLFLAIFILSCVPVRLINPNFNTTYVKVKINPEETEKDILKGKVKSEVYIDDGYLPPRYSWKKSTFSSYLRIPQGKHKVTIKAEGYKTWEKAIFFAGRFTVLNIEMEKEKIQ